MRKLRIVQQYVAAKNGGGLETEFRALCGRETLTSEFDLIPVVLENAHPGISPADIRFYRRAFRAAEPTLYISGAPESKARTLSLPRGRRVMPAYW